MINIEKKQGYLLLTQYSRIYPSFAMKDLGVGNNKEEWPLFFNPFFYHNDIDCSHRSQRLLFLQISHGISPTMTQVMGPPGSGNR